MVNTPQTEKKKDTSHLEWKEVVKEPKYKPNDQIVLQNKVVKVIIKIIDKCYPILLDFCQFEKKDNNIIINYTYNNPIRSFDAIINLNNGINALWDIITLPIDYSNLWYGATSKIYNYYVYSYISYINMFLYQGWINTYVSITYDYCSETITRIELLKISTYNRDEYKRKMEYFRTDTYRRK